MAFLKQNAVWIGVTLALAVFIHVGTITQLPSIIMGIVMDRMAEHNGLNTLAHVPAIDASSRTVVSPSPDLLYSVCVFDLSENDLRITSPVPQEGYWSVSLYDGETNTFFVRNNVGNSAGGDLDDIDVLLVSPSGNLPVADTDVVQAPTDRGLILFRRLIKDPDDLPALDAFRQLATCEVVAR